MNTKQSGKATLLGMAVMAVVGGALAITVVVGGAKIVRDKGWLSKPTQAPVTAEVVSGIEDMPRGALVEQPPMQTPPPAVQAALPLRHGVKDAAHIRMAQIAWNATVPTHLANGGANTSPGSIMARYGLSMEIVRQDDYSKQTEGMTVFAKDWKDGAVNSDRGFNATMIMGDGGPGYMKGVQNALSKFDGKGIIIYATGFSYGEDKCIGPKQWLDNPQSMKGAVVAAVRGDGDIHLGMDFAKMNGIRINPNQDTWDPQGLNVVGVDKFQDADLKFTTGAKATYKYTLSEDGKKKVPGEVTKQVGGTCTWTPGDSFVALNYKGGVPLAAVRTTADNVWQMPATIIVHKDWAYKHFDQTVDMVLAFSEAADLIRSSDAALWKTSGYTAQIYAEQDPKYWHDMFKGGVKAKNQQIQFTLGGSRVINLADNMLYFEVTPGSANTFRRVYNYFAKLDMHAFPDLFDDGGKISVPAYDDVVDTSFIKAAGEKLAKRGVTVAAAVPDYKNAVTSVAIGNVAYQDILFDTGKDTLKSESKAALDNMLTDLASAGGKLEIIGHTDDVGSRSSNLALSKRRAAAVAKALKKAAPMSFTADRFALIDGKGFDEPPKDLDGVTSPEEKRERMRRVQIIVDRTDNLFKAE